MLFRKNEKYPKCDICFYLIVILRVCSAVKSKNIVFIVSFGYVSLAEGLINMSCVILHHLQSVIGKISEPFYSTGLAAFSSPPSLCLIQLIIGDASLADSGRFWNSSLSL